MERAKNETGKADAQPQDQRDARSGQRFTLLIRSAKLVCESGEYLCIVRDVSEYGLKLRLYHPVPADGPLRLELASGQSYSIEPRWVQDDHAGFQFASPIDLSNFIAEASPYPKRSVRLRIDLPCTLIDDDGMHAGIIRDLSRQGARIETSHLLAMQQKLKIDAKGLPSSRIATVRWRANSEYGLALEELFTFEELAKLAARLRPITNPACPE